MLLLKYGLATLFTLVLTASAGVIVDRDALSLEGIAVDARAVKITTSTSSSTTKTTTSSTVKTSSTSEVSRISSIESSSSSVSSTKTSSSSSSSTSLVADSSCTNGPFTRQCWGSGFSIATDYDTAWPVTGNTASYTLTITNTTMAPDGTERLVMAINGQYPGPTLYANWGDTLVVTVVNNLQDNGTSMHWHGIRQMNSGNMDGTNGVTECPIPPGSSKTYTFLLTQFGTSWYHSHYSAQYGDGVVGPIVIAGPATSNYDVDLGAMPINDWYYQTAFQNAILSSISGPPIADNALINGTMLNPSGTGGAYNKVTLTSGKKYRLRLINTSVDNHFRVSLDNHNLTVIQTDFVPTQPYVAEWIFIGIGQRYDVIIDANQAVDNYWFRAEVMTACGSNNNNGNIMSIFSYAGAADANPTSTGTTAPQNCNDESGLIPYVVKNVDSTNFLSEYETLDVLLDFGIASNGQSVAQWNVNGSVIDVDWEDPTLKYVEDGNTTFATDLNLIQLPEANKLHFWIIQAIAGNVATVPHPIHLHGHDFYLLGSGTGNFSDPSSLQYSNPPRRDVAMLPAGGWLVLAFETDNPGAWLMHCHIAWHVGEGLAVQFLERASEIPSTFSLGDIGSECAAWDSWYATSYYKKDDSGL